jgi:NodT family efflux transporter outer membrane factor (OMF) lipoprotein
MTPLCVPGPFAARKGRGRPYRQFLLAGIALCAAALSACVPNLGPAPKLSQPGAYSTAQSFAAPEADWPTDAWWTVYGDPELNKLEDEAIRGAPDLKAAQARARAANAVIEQARSALLPQVNGTGSIQTSKESLNEGYPAQFLQYLPAGYHTQTNINANVDWQLDFFGKNHAALSAAKSSAAAAAADEAAARLQITAAVASAYADLVRLYADRDEAVDALRVRKDTLDLVGRRLHNGLETRGEFSQQAETVPAAQGDLEAIDQQILVTRHQIAALMGEGPDRGLEIPRPTATKLHPYGLPPHLSADLIGRRPDIVAARWRAEAAAKQIKVAKADFYPNIDLTGLYGVQSLGINELFRYSSVVGAVGPAIHLPIFTGGRLEGAYRGARAEYDASVANYDQALTNALRDVADAVTAQGSLQKQIADAEASRDAAEDAFRISKLRYQGGLSPYLNVLTAENGVLTARRNVADLQAQSLSLDVALVRALGGGYIEPNRLAVR